MSDEWLNAIYWSSFLLGTFPIKECVEFTQYVLGRQYKIMWPKQEKFLAFYLW